MDTSGDNIADTSFDMSSALSGKNSKNGSYSEFEAAYGGCDEKYGMGGFVAILLLLTAIILIYYVATFVSDMKILRGEKVCGGKDQGCVCDGSETMTGSKYPEDITADKWSKVAMGY